MKSVLSVVKESASKRPSVLKCVEYSFAKSSEFWTL